MASRGPLVYIVVWAVLVLTAVAETIVAREGLVGDAKPVFLGAVAMVQGSLIAMFYQYLRGMPLSIQAMPLSSLVLLVVLIVSAIVSVLACTPYLIPR